MVGKYGRVFLINLILSELISFLRASLYLPSFVWAYLFILIVKGFVWKPPDNFEQPIIPLWNGWFICLMGPIVGFGAKLHMNTKRLASSNNLQS